MYPRFAFALLFSVCAFGLGIAIPAFPDQKCGLNAEFLHCGSACVPDCANPETPTKCTLQCISGCFCKEGFLKNAKGICVRPHECENQIPKIPFQFPSAVVLPTCPDNEVFQTCGSACAPTCANPLLSRMCTKNCVIGCFCKEGHLRNDQGVCVPASQCQAPKMSANFAYPPEMQCNENEIFMPCGSACSPTCSNPHPGPMCTRQCVIGCFCKPGYLKNEQGVCIKAEKCGVPSTEAHPVQAPVCGPNEEYRQCKGCDGTCLKPNPICPRICVPGCACKHGHVRAGTNGQCVPQEQCKNPNIKTAQGTMMPPPPPPHKCPSDREVYMAECGTQSDCAATCHMPPTFLVHGIPQMPLQCRRVACAGACACIYPYVRNTDGQCVERKDCDPITSTPAN